ncbi:MAG: C25 family cysteine peptidase, partial [candidate division WOR-3 bacterium]
MKKLFILLIIPLAILLAQNGVTVTQVSFDKVLVNVSLPTLSITTTEIAGRTFSELAFPNAGISTEIGAPQLPVIREFIEIPYGADVDIDYQIIKTEYYYPPHPILPLQYPIPKSGPKPDFVLNEDIYNQNQFLTFVRNEEKTDIRARIEMIGEIRGHRVALIEIYPIAYNPKENIIEYAPEIKVNLTFHNANLLLTEQMRNRYYSKPYDMMLRGLIKNYDAYCVTPPPDLPVGYLIIVPDEWVSYVQPLAQWRARKGYKVFVRTLTQVGGGTNTTVRNYILNAYNTWSIPPTFVLLVGDIDKIGYFTGQGSGSPPTDLNYSMMTTPDYLPDIDVSRASVANGAQLDSLVKKTIKYEKNEWISGTEWAKKAFFIASADPSYHGVAEGTHRYCMARMRRAGYNVICDSVFAYYTSGSPAIITQKLNEGRAWVTYSGHGSETGWSDYNGLNYSTSDV